MTGPFITLARKFYEPAADDVAPQLLGHWLIRNTGQGPVGGVIVETEAYLSQDPASHSFPGPTNRNRVMFGPPGHGYVYLIYGYHFCVNAVCGRVGIGEAVLVRALEPVFGEATLRQRRPSGNGCGLTNGPAKLCQAMNIDRTLDGVDLCDPGAVLFIARNPDVHRYRREQGPIVVGPRVGITRAASLPLRFYLDRSRWVSGRKFGTRCVA